MDVSTLRVGLSDALNRAGFGGERIVLQRRGKAVAALVPLRDLRQLEGDVAQEPSGPSLSREGG
jgi:antitoxin (DNA-binding transcriptional repressor) of toxin-antitoxin stability system